MEQEPGPSYRNRKVCLGLAILVVVLFLLWLASTARPVGPAIRVSLSPRQSGHMGNFYSHDFVVAFVTNATTGNMVLGNPFLQWEDAGDITVGVASLWGGTNESCSIGPGEVMPLPIRVPPTSRKFKISLGYSRDAGPLQKVFGPALRPVLSAVVGRLFARRNGPNQPLVQWLFDHGWLNGHLNLSYEGESEISGPAPSAPPDSR